MQTDAQLVLKSGEVFHGKVPDSQADISFGEVVFNTGMVGYVETLTDPSYAGQILVFTYPLMGNYGVSPASSWESKKIHAKGVIFSELSPFYSNHAAEKSLRDWLTENNIPFMTEVDTRALTKCLRDKGVVPGAIVPTGKTAKEFGDFEHTHWVREVSIKQPEEVGSGEKLIIAVDCGMKENIMRNLLKYPVRIKRVPFDYDYSNEDFDGVFLSNGPGDPVMCQDTVNVLAKAMQKKKPIFGICLGTQMMALAVGAKTFKLRFGHRSQNQPCLYIPTNRSYLTSQNHGYAIEEDSLPEGWQVSFRNLNDGSVAGIAHESLPFFSVQFHPESAPGPEDTEWLFKQFMDLIHA